MIYCMIHWQLAAAARRPLHALASAVQPYDMLGKVKLDSAVPTVGHEHCQLFLCELQPVLQPVSATRPSKARVWEIDAGVRFRWFSAL
jgi:hypothetical protein